MWLPSFQIVNGYLTIARKDQNICQIMTSIRTINNILSNMVGLEENDFADL